MKATDTLFSAKRRLRRFGIMKAIEKASERAEVPRKAALVISRTRPRTRETRVRAERRVPLRRRDWAMGKDITDPALWERPGHGADAA
jgi:hypothetical protein